MVRRLDNEEKMTTQTTSRVIDGIIPGASDRKAMTTYSRTKVIHEAGYAAEVEVEIIDTEDGWAPYLSLAEAQKLDAVRKALREGDLLRATQLARVFELTPVTI